MSGPKALLILILKPVMKECARILSRELGFPGVEDRNLHWTIFWPNMATCPDFAPEKRKRLIEFIRLNVARQSLSPRPKVMTIGAPHNWRVRSERPRIINCS